MYMYNTDVMFLLYYIVCKSLLKKYVTPSAIYLQIRNISHPTLSYQYSDLLSYNVNGDYEVFMHTTGKPVYNRHSGD